MADSGFQGISIPGPVAALLRRHDLFRPLIQRQVVAEAVAAVTVNQDEREQLLNAYMQRHRLAEMANLDSHLSDRALDRGNLEWLLELPLRTQRYALEAFGPKAEQRFLERKNNLDQVVYSLLRLKDGFLARELYLQVLEGESDFADLAARYAEGPERTTRGVLGPVPLTQAHPVLAERLRTTTPGVLMEPFPIEDWWLVVRLERYLPATFDEAMRNRMCSELFEEWVQEEVSRRLSAFSLSNSAATAA